MQMISTSFHHFNHQYSFHKSCVTISLNNTRLYTVRISNRYLCSMLSMAGGARPASGHRPLASDWGPMRLSVLCSLYMNIWLVLVFVYTTQKSKSLDYPSQDRLPNWQSGAPQPLPLHRMHACTPRTVAAVLTQLLGHIRPFTGGVLFIFWVRIVLGN